MAQPVTVWWSPGEWEGDLHGFLTREDRDAYDRGEAGPFQRIVRSPALGPVPFEARVTRSYLNRCGVHRRPILK
jgi:hypothetical protein